jgi:hypothetical protein
LALAAKIGGVGFRSIRDWVLRFNARGPNALVNGKSPGPYIFGAVCPKRGKGAALPACNTEAMNLHLAEIAAAVELEATVFLVAGWHMSTRLVVPAHVTIITLPPNVLSLTRLRTYGIHMRQLAFKPRIISLGWSWRTRSDQWDSVLGHDSFSRTHYINLERHRKKLIKLHTSHRQGEANTLATASAISL